MFKKKDDIIENIDSLFGEDIKIIGNIEGKGNLRIDGTIEGDIDYNGNIVISETGTVKGNVKANDITLSGSVNGNISSKSKVVILATGILIGDLEVSSFVVHENAKFDGSCKMVKNTPKEMNLKKNVD